MERKSLVILVAIILAAVIMRIHLLPMPLERDEGEYAYAAWLINQGIPPYTQVYNMKLPGIYYTYALILRTFGESPASIRTAFLIIHVLTIVIFFLLTRRLWDDQSALWAVGVYVCLSINPFTHGHFAQAEHLVIILALASLLVLTYALRNQRLPLFFLAGFLACSSFLMKQHAAGFIAFAYSWILAEAVGSRQATLKGLTLKMVTFTMGLALPMIITVLYFKNIGILDRFFFWTVVYAREYVSFMSPEEGLKNLEANLGPIVRHAPFLWILVGVGLAILCLDYRHSSALQRRFLWLFVLFSLLTVTPGFHFREHYALLFLPAASLLAAQTLKGITDASKNTGELYHQGTVWILVGMILGLSVIPFRTYLFQMEPSQAIRFTHTLNPFPESILIAEYLRHRSDKNDMIAIIGSEPQIYYYARRKAATGYIYTYPLMEPQRYAMAMQKEMIAEIEGRKPKYLVFVHIPTSWLIKSSSSPLILDWFNGYAHQHYQQCGLIEIPSDGQSIYFWDDEARHRSPRSPLWISLHERKDENRQ